MTDTPEEIETKINKYAFSGGRDTMKEHREKGGDLKVDVPYQYLNVFEFDDEKVRRIGEEFGSGRMGSAQIKKELIEVLKDFIGRQQGARKDITDEVVNEYMKIRPLEWKGKK
jgi:tryptophanyl-tRNA synthetase